MIELTIENERLKKLYSDTKGGWAAGLRSFKSEEFEIIYRLSNTFPVETMCEIMHVSRSGYYKWLGRDKPVDDKRQKAVEAVRKAHQEHTSHGYRWICAYLKENNIIAISESYTHKIMKVLGLKSETRHKLHYKPRKVKDKYPNIRNNAPKQMHIKFLL